MSRLTCRATVKGAAAAVTALVVLTLPLPAGAEDDPTTELGDAAQQTSAGPWQRSVETPRRMRARLTPTVPAAADDPVQQLVHGVNTARADAGLAPLRVDLCLARWATSWSVQMASEGSLTHQSLAGMLEECGAGRAGENLGQTTRPVETLTAAWLNSEGHRRNILDPRWTSIGIGVARSADGTWYATQDFASR